MTMFEATKAGVSTQTLHLEALVPQMRLKRPLEHVVHFHCASLGVCECLLPPLAFRGKQRQVRRRRPRRFHCFGPSGVGWGSGVTVRF